MHAEQVDGALGGPVVDCGAVVELWHRREMTDGRTTVFVARRFHTMEPGFPTAEAVAVRDGRILAVGSLATVTGALGDR